MTFFFYMWIYLLCLVLILYIDEVFLGEKVGGDGARDYFERGHGGY